MSGDKYQNISCYTELYLLLLFHYMERIRIQYLSMLRGPTHINSEIKWVVGLLQDNEIAFVGISIETVMDMDGANYQGWDYCQINTVLDSRQYFQYRCNYADFNVNVILTL